jgi:hypothetical protein
LQDTGNVIFIQSVKSYYNAGTCNYEFVRPGLDDDPSALGPCSVLRCGRPGR